MHGKQKLRTRGLHVFSILLISIECMYRIWIGEFLVPEMVPAEHGELREGVRRLLVPPEGTRWRPKL
jgi:hypothetical protein